MAKKIKVGDTVIWKGNFGHDVSKEAVVESIEIDCHGKHGDDVDEVEYPKGGLDRTTVFSLANGHWCYGDQVKPLN